MSFEFGFVAANFYQLALQCKSTYKRPVLRALHPLQVFAPVLAIVTLTRRSC